MIEADAAEAEGCFALATGVGDDHDRPVATQHASRPGRVLAASPTLMLPARCAAANSAGSRVSSNWAPTCLQGQHVVERQRVHFASQRLVERGPLLAVQNGIVGEVGRRVRLVGGDQVDESLFGHRLERVVRSPLLADCRDRFLAQRLAAERSGAVRRVDQAGIGQRQQLPRSESYSSPPSSPADQPSATRRSGRPTSPTNSVSPVRTACGSVVLESRS